MYNNYMNNYSPLIVDDSIQIITLTNHIFFESKF